MKKKFEEVRDVAMELRRRCPSAPSEKILYSAFRVCGCTHEEALGWVRMWDKEQLKEI